MQLEHFHAIDSKAGIVMGFAGALVDGTPGGGRAADCIGAGSTMSRMEKDAEVPGKPTVDETPPPFEPDPDIVTFLERGERQDPKEVWKATAKAR